MVSGEWHSMQEAVSDEVSGWQAARSAKAAMTEHRAMSADGFIFFPFLLARTLVKNL